MHTNLKNPVMDIEHASIVQCSISSVGFGPWHNESFNVATVRENSKNILQRYVRRRIPSPHVTLHGDHSESLINLKNI